LLEAQCFLAKNDIDAALHLLSAPDLRDSRSSETIARRRMLEGNAFSKRGQFAEANKAFEQAFALATGSGATVTLIETQMNRALTHLAQRDLDRGEQFLRDALAIAVEQHDGYHEAAALLNFGFLAAKRGRFDEAALLSERVLALCNRRPDAGILKSGALVNLSLCYSRLGDFGRALSSGEKAIDFQRKAGLRAYLMPSLGEMGNIYVLAGRWEEAIPWYRQAYEMALSANAKTQMAMWRSSLALVLALSGHFDEADRVVEDALRLRSELNDPQGQAFGWITKGRIEAGQGRTREALQAFQRVLATTNDTELAWDAHSELGNLFDHSGDKFQSQMHYESALKLIERARSDLLRTEFRITFLSRLIQFYQRYVEKLVRDKRDDRALELADATHARVLAERLQSKSGRYRSMSAADFRQIARISGATIASYWITPEGSHVWVITKDGIHRESLAPQARIAKLVDDHRTVIEDKIADPLTTGHPAARELYDTLVRPIERWIPRGSKVIIVPDGPLNSINFETLVVSAPKPHYWLEDVTISIAPSLHLLEGLRDRPSKEGSLLLIGDAVPAEARYPKLRYASAEMAQLRTYFQSVTERAGAAATPASYAKTQPQAFPMIHFAAHAEANRESPLDSAIILSPDGGRYKLYSRDVAATPIRAELVTLSACRGAGARAYSGEGLVGFSWAFLEAGARNVVAGLWDVSDRSTAELMDRLYKGLTQENLDAAEALKQAKLSMLHKGGAEAKPFYWAPFQLYTRVYRSPDNHPRKKTNSH
jgi:CHAT domain-containing protein/Flp pilus assembly protein TadD